MSTENTIKMCHHFGCNRAATCGDVCCQHCNWNYNRKPQQTHYLKTWKEYYQQVVAGIKEFDNETGLYTGAIFKTTISYILKGGQFGIEEGYVVFGFKKFKI